MLFLEIYYWLFKGRLWNVQTRGQHPNCDEKKVSMISVINLWICNLKFVQGYEISLAFLTYFWNMLSKTEFIVNNDP